MGHGIDAAGGSPCATGVTRGHARASPRAMPWAMLRWPFGPRNRHGRWIPVRRGRRVTRGDTPEVAGTKVCIDAAPLGGCKIGVALPARFFFSRKSAEQRGCGKILTQNPACSRCSATWLRLEGRDTRCIVLLPVVRQPKQRCRTLCATATARRSRCTADFSGKIGVARNQMTVQPRGKIDAIGVMAKRARGIFDAADARPSLREKISLTLPAQASSREKIGVAFVARPIFWKKSTLHSLHGRARGKKSAMHSLHGRFSGKNRPCSGGKVHETLPLRQGTGVVGVESFRDGPVPAILAS